MYIFQRITDLQHYLQQQRHIGHRIGFVPTMGALHAGHLSLIERAQQSTQCVVCSIFVNPTQFNDPKDFEKYPRTPATDCGLLIEQGCDVLFMPPVSEMYPSNGKPTAAPIDLDGLDQHMEGEHRPGHFAGMLQVVSLLLQIVQPDELFMGQKDFQQLAIVRHYLHTTHSPIQLIGCPTLREANGLAMSSRNERLSPQQRQQAAHIYAVLQHIAQHYRQADHWQALVQQGIEQLNALPNFVVEYLTICHAISLQPITTPQLPPPSQALALCIALKVGEVRLIDNVLLP